MSKSFKRVLALLAAIFIIAFAGAAFAATTLTPYVTHITEVPLVNGKPSYTSAVFGRVEFYLSSPDAETTGDDEEDFEATTGTLTVNGGDFSFGDSPYVLHQGKDASSGQTFDLTNDEDDAAVFRPLGTLVNEDTEEEYQATVSFAGTESNEGMNGYTVSWTFDDDGIADGNATLPAFKSTAQQMASFVPYVELITSGNNVTGLTWRIVNPSNPSTALTAAAGLTSLTINFGTSESAYYVEGDLSSGGNKFSGTVTQAKIEGADSAAAFSFSQDILQYIDVTLVVNNDARYVWSFKHCTPQVRFQFRSKIKAYLVNGKTSYENAQFKEADITIHDGSNLSNERSTSKITNVEIITDLEEAAIGTLTLSGASGSYTYGNASVKSSAAASQTFRMRNDYDKEKFYFPCDAAGNYICLYGGVDTGALKNAALAVSFADLPEMNTSTTVPSTFWTMSEQLNNAVPYIEIVTDSTGQNVTGAKWRVVKSSSPSTALTLTDLPNFGMIRIEPYHEESGGRMTKTVHRTLRGDLVDGAALEGTITFEKSFPLADIKYFETRLNIYASDTDREGTGSVVRESQYRWCFFTDADENVSSADTGVPLEAAVSSADATGVLGVAASEIKSLGDGGDAAVDREREPEEVCTADAAAAASGDNIPALILPQLTIKTAGIYLFNIVFNDTSLYGNNITFFALPQSESTSTTSKASIASTASRNFAAANKLYNFKAAASIGDSEGSYVLLDASGNVIDKIPDDGRVTVLVRLKASETYAPIVSSFFSGDIAASSGDASFDVETGIVAGGQVISNDFIDASGEISADAVNKFFADADETTPVITSADLQKINSLKSITDFGDANTGYKVLGVNLSSDIDIKDITQFLVILRSDSGDMSVGIGAVASGDTGSVLPIVFSRLRDPSSTDKYMSFNAGDYDVGATNSFFTSSSAGSTSRALTSALMFRTAANVTFSVALSEQIRLAGQTASGDSIPYVEVQVPPAPAPGGDDDETDTDTDADLDTDTDSDTETATSSHGSSSGCSLSFGGLAALLALGFIALKRRF